ncbi:MAG: DUF1573 domain-containing protein [Candidatus Methylomirabilales bacterium]
MRKYNPTIVLPTIFGLLFLSVLVAMAHEKTSKAVLQESRYDFGTVMEGATVRHTIPLRNAGGADLVIKNMSLSLPSLTARLKKVIPPGEEAQITLELDTAGLKGDVQGDVLLDTNDPHAPRLRIRITGRVRGLIEVRPRPTIFLSAFRWEVEEKERGVTIVNLDDRPLEVLGIQAESDRFRPHLRTMEEGQRYQLSVKLRPEAPSGKAQGRITVSTNKGDIGILVFTFLKDRVYVTPPQIDFGRISLAQLAKNPDLVDFLAQTVFINKHAGRDFRIQVQSSLPSIAIEKTPPQGPAAVVNIPRHGPTAIIELRVVPLNERLKPGEFQGTIRVLTNDRDFPELVIPVRGEVR